MEWLVVSRVLQSFILPPGGPLVLCFIGVIVMRRRRRRRLGRGFIAVGLIFIYVFSAPVFTQLVGRPLYSVEAVVDPTNLQGAQAIVVLGAGIRPNAPEYGRDTIGGQAVDRVRYGAYLYRASGVPLLVTGGLTRPPTSEAEAMRAVLEDEFGVPVRWVEDRAFNTRENAVYSRELLAADGINRIALVTSGYHIRRAMKDFENVGFKVLPAPTKMPGPWNISFRSFLPSAGAMTGTRNHIHEWLGLAWSAIRGGD